MTGVPDEAVQAAAAEMATARSHAAEGAAAFLRYHQTEGREQLVEVVMRTLVPVPGYVDDDGVRYAGFTVADRRKAEAVVTALVGPASEDGGRE